MKVLVAMSGGVDSSVAAALMKDEGHDVVGATLKLWAGADGGMPSAGCCTLSDSEGAGRVAAELGIPYHVLDYTEDFRDGVVDRFIRDYASGRTPNPCVECNRIVKFDRLLSRLDDFGCDVLVTGHHARVREAEDGWRLLRGADPAKDQSYVLSMLTQEQLARVRFPVGEMTKKKIRAIAASMGMRSAHKPESMDICFVGDGDYRGFLAENAPEVFRPGKLVDVAGREVGTHDGIVGFTVGQRRGLGAATTGPRFVVRIEPESSTVVIGGREDLNVSSVALSEITWAQGERPGADLMVQYRAHGEPTPARLEGDTIVFEAPQEAIAPGQTIAFYDGDRVLGGALIAGTGR